MAFLLVLFLIHGISVLFFRRNLPQNPAGNTDGDHVRGYGTSDDAAGPDDGIISNGNPRQNGCARADPDVIADGYRQGDLKTGVALLNIQRVPRGGEAAVRRNEHMIAEGYRRAVEYHKIMIVYNLVQHV